MIQTNSRDFRNNQAFYFNMAQKGEDVLISRKGKFFMLTPVKNEEISISPELKARAEEAQRERENGSIISFTSKDEMHSWLDSLCTE